MAKQGLVLRRLSGADISPELWDQFYDFYLDTVSSLACSAPCSQFEFERGPVSHLSVQCPLVQCACCMIHLPLKSACHCMIHPISLSNFHFVSNSD